ncbi:MAG: hypothetical protein PX636_20870 [Microcystis sp. M53598_WE2]|nr:hypothetical protein [Microcystis sp. M53598_WE2]
MIDSQSNFKNPVMDGFFPLPHFPLPTPHFPLPHTPNPINCGKMRYGSKH